MNKSDLIKKTIIALAIILGVFVINVLLIGGFELLQYRIVYSYYLNILTTRTIPK